MKQIASPRILILAYSKFDLSRKPLLLMKIAVSLILTYGFIAYWGLVSSPTSLLTNLPKLDVTYKGEGAAKFGIFAFELICVFSFSKPVVMITPLTF